MYMSLCLAHYSGLLKVAKNSTSGITRQREPAAHLNLGKGGFLQRQASPPCLRVTGAFWAGSGTSARRTGVFVRRRDSLYIGEMLLTYTNNTEAVKVKVSALTVNRVHRPGKLCPLSPANVTATICTCKFPPPEVRLGTDRSHFSCSRHRPRLSLTQEQ